MRRGDRTRLAGTLGVSARTLCNWQRKEPGRPGRRPRPAADRRRALLAVARAWHRAGRAAGRTKVAAELAAPVPRDLLCELLGLLKARWRRRTRERTERARVSAEVLRRDALWSLDATDLVAGAEAVVVRDAATTATVALGVGPAPRGEDLVAVLEAAEESRGTAPLVLAQDNGGAMRSEPVHAWAERRGVVLLYGLPRTPQHNAWSETGMRDLKLEAGIATRRGRARRPRRAPGGARRPARRPRATPEALLRLAKRLGRARWRIDTCLRRTTRGGLVASALDAALPRWDVATSRVAFREAACNAIREALAVPGTARARRIATREAILATLQRSGLVRRTRGGAPLLAVKPEIIS